MPMDLHVANHPLIDHKVTVLRDQTTPSPTFRRLVDELVTLLAYEATRHVRVEQRAVVTPLTTTTGTRIADPAPLIVPILRAGLGMLDGMTRLLPSAEVGFLGLKRDEKTLEAVTYANRLPEDLTGRQVFILDPMLATGGSLIAAIDYVLDRGATDVTCVCLLAAPEGIDHVRAHVIDTLGRGQETHARHVGGAAVEHIVNRSHECASGGEHRVKNEHLASREVLGQPVGVRHGLKGFLVALEPQESHLGAGQQPRHPIQHS